MKVLKSVEIGRDLMLRRVFRNPEESRCVVGKSTLGHTEDKQQTKYKYLETKCWQCI